MLQLGDGKTQFQILLGEYDTTWTAVCGRRSHHHHGKVARRGFHPGEKPGRSIQDTHPNKYSSLKYAFRFRVYFGLAFLSVVVLSGWFISNIYVKWTASPIIIATSHKLTPTTEIPFPAITICNLNQALRSKVEDIPK